MEKKEVEEKLSNFEIRFGELSKSVSEKIDNLTISFSKVLESIEESKRKSSSREPPPPQPKAYEEASHAVELLKNLSKITKEISEANSKAIMEGLAVGVKLGEVAGQAREAESRLEDQEGEIEELNRLLAKVAKNGGDSLGETESVLFNKLLKVAADKFEKIG